MNRAKKDKITKLFVGTLKKKFKNQLKKVILFGSRARGDNTSESDYDFILIFKKVTKKIDEYLNKLGAESLLKHGAVITDISITEKDLKKMQYEPFIMNAQREDILVLKVLANTPGIDCNFDFGLPHKEVLYTCLAETMALAATNWDGNFTIGHVKPDQVLQAKKFADECGFTVSEFVSFNKFLSKEDIEKIRLAKNKIGLMQA